MPRAVLCAIFPCYSRYEYVINRGTEAIMKPDIHPKYETARVHCACGNEFETKSTTGAISVEICSNCHPFFTGKQKLMDTAGRVERFRQRYANVEATK